MLKLSFQLLSYKNECSFFFYLVKSCIFAFFFERFSYRFVYYGVVLLFAFGRTDRILLLIKKAVVREGVQSHQKFKNRKEKIQNSKRA